jgi:flagellum-specific ATP synthase
MTVPDAADPAQRPPRGNAVGDPLERLARLFAGHPGGLPLVRYGGRVTEVTPSHVLVRGIERRVELGTSVEVEGGGARWLGEVIGIEPDCANVKLFSSSPRLGLGAPVWIRDSLEICPDVSWLGRVINALGQPIDDQGPLAAGSLPYSIDHEPIPPMALDRVRRPIVTGVKAIDLFTPICAGQRIGIFAGSGVGKSTLVSMLARTNGFNTIVIALVAERGREVREFLDDVVKPHAPRAITVVASSSEGAMMRKNAAKTAMAVAEYFRDRGDNVLLVVDSITRFAHALREVALAAGEPPVARGYAPSVFAELPRLLERAGPGKPGSGSITGVFSVLLDGEDTNEPVADTVRGILDGHIVLDRTIADQGRYPAINPLTSISRLAPLAWSKEEAELVRRLRTIIARYEETRDLRAVGAYKAEADFELDQAVLLTPILYRFLAQFPDDPPCPGVFSELAAVLSEMRNGGRQGKEGEGTQIAARLPA